jgi:hypothetical protein
VKNSVVVRLFVLALLAGCTHRARGEFKIIVETGPSDEALATDDSDAGPGRDPAYLGTTPLERRVFEDEQRAAEILVDGIGDEDRRVAAWAAVYAIRLGLKHDEVESEKALFRGAAVPGGGPLLRALCWGLLAARDKLSDLPKWRPGRNPDPVVQVMAALALARRGSLPKGLVSALGLPSARPKGPDRGVRSRESVEQLLFLAEPFDVGPLALAIGFVEARRGEWTEQDQRGKTDWVSRRIRRELTSLVLKADETAIKRVMRSASAGSFGQTGLGERLRTPLVNRSLHLLRNAALAGPDDLRRDALRAISIVADKPVAGDLGAAASALVTDSPLLRLEGARTFLMLSTRSRRSR